MVRAEDDVGNEDTNTNAVPETSVSPVTVDISLTAGGGASGWNFVSFNLSATDTSLTGILEDPSYGISGNYDKVMYYDVSSDTWKTYVAGRSDVYNSLSTWTRSKGVWIHMTTSDTLTVEGHEPTTTDIVLEPGWNMVGYPSSYSGNNGLPSEVTKIGYFDGATAYNIAYDYNPGSFSFTPKEGYWIYNGASSAVTWTVNY